MKTNRALLFIAIGFLVGFSVAFFFEPETVPTGLISIPPDSLNANFCPIDACNETLIRQIDSATQSIDIAIYSFTLDELSDALINAHQRQVKIRVLFDDGESNSQYSEDEKLSNAGIQIKRLDKSRGLMHNKYAIFDHETVATGSYNYSQNATQYNNENLLILKNKNLASEYTADFERLWNQTQ